MAGEFSDRRNLGIEVGMGVAHGDSDGRMGQQFLHRHDVHSSFQKARCKGMTQRVPRHSRDPRLFASKFQTRV